MPQIIVTADRGPAFGEGAVMLRERVSVADFESRHFATQLVERLGWAVEDADRAEQAPEPEDRRGGVRDRRSDRPGAREHVSEPSGQVSGRSGQVSKPSEDVRDEEVSKPSEEVTDQVLV